MAELVRPKPLIPGGPSLSELARMSGLSLSFLSRIGSGARRPAARTAVLLAQIHNITVDELYSALGIDSSDTRHGGTVADSTAARGHGDTRHGGGSRCDVVYGRGTKPNAARGTEPAGGGGRGK